MSVGASTSSCVPATSVSSVTGSKLLFVSTGRMIKSRTEQEALAVLDADTLAELARIPADPKLAGNGSFETPRFW